MEPTYKEFLESIDLLKEDNNISLLEKIHEILFTEIPFKEWIQTIKSSGVVKVIYSFFKMIKFSIKKLIDIISFFLKNIFKIIKVFLKIQKYLIKYIQTGDQRLISKIRRTIEAIAFDVLIFGIVIVLVKFLFSLSLPSIPEIISFLQSAIGVTIEFITVTLPGVIEVATEIISNGIDRIIVILDKVLEVVMTEEFVKLFIIFYLGVATLSIFGKRKPPKRLKHKDYYFA